jgi:nucleotide-binding universal stress UspA family protein
MDTEIDPSSKAIVVVAVDMTDVSEHLLVTAKNLLRHAADAQLHLVHVLPIQPVVPWFDHAVLPSTDADARRVAQARFELGRLCEDLSDRPTLHVEVHTPIGDATEEIVRIATNLHADAIVVEAHDRSGLAGMLHRSVVAGVTKRAPCSVITVRGAHMESPPLESSSVTHSHHS